MEDWIKIYDNYSGKMKFSKPVSLIEKYVLSDTIILLICLKGHARFNVRFKEYTLSEGSFMAIGAGTPFYYTERSRDMKVNIITIKESAFDKLAPGLIRIYFRRLIYSNPLHHIPADKMEMCNMIHSYLKGFIGRNDNYFKRQIVRNYLDIMFYEACNILLHEPEIEKSKDRHKDEIAGNFIMLLEKHFKTSRKVEFFARELNITPKYLSTVVKESTGRTASAWIDDYTVMEARNMLKSSTKTIQEISYDLGFATPSHFSKFFKDKTGLTPKEARANHN